MARPIVHKFGFGKGKFLEQDGTVEYVPAGKLLPVFKIRIADVTSFTSVKAKKRFEMRLCIYGAGTTLTEIDVPYGMPEKIEAWFRAHPDFSGGAVTLATHTAAMSPAASTADELVKLAALRDQGVLTDEEFAAQKAKLLD